MLQRTLYTSSILTGAALCGQFCYKKSRRESVGFATIAQRRHYKSICLKTNEFASEGMNITWQEGKITDISYKMHSEDIGSKVKNAVKAILFFMWAPCHAMTTAALSHQACKKHAFQVVCLAMIINLSIQIAAVNLETKRLSNERYLKNAVQEFPCNPRGGRSIDRTNDIIDVESILKRLFNEYIITSEGQKWLNLVKAYHNCNEEEAYLRLMVGTLGGTCAGWSRSLVKAVAIQKQEGLSPLIQLVNKEDIVSYTLLEYLSYNPLMVEWADEIKKDFYDTYDTDLSEIRESANKILHAIPLTEKLADSPSMTSTNSSIDLRGHADYKKFTNMIDTMIAPYEKEGNTILAVMRIHSDSFGHGIFIQYSGDQLRFCCNEKGLYEVPNRNILHQEVMKYLQSFSAPVREISLDLYRL
jgi:hypothetical protein